MQSWHPKSWQERPCAQKVDYASSEAVQRALAELALLPPLVTPMEISNLKQQLACAAKGEAFILQGGDCAESFASCQTNNITNKLKILLQMSLVLIHGLRKPVIRVGRIAGQYAKPRSSNFETQGELSLPSYRGDLINQPGFSAAEREPDPKRMLSGYSYAALTLNYIRALIASGFADLQHPENWNLDFVKHSPSANKYLELVRSIEDTLSFVRSIHGVRTNILSQIELFTSHEALHLYYEQALARQDGQGNWYDASAHFPWIGMRTAKIDEAHVEFCRGISNPIGVKIGPQITPEWLEALVQTLNPTNEPGRLTLITRLGAKQVETLLPTLIETVKKIGKTVVWSCDPMHGNTEKTATGVKTRRFDDILTELRLSFAIHKKMYSYLGGVHFELTGEDVTECIGGARGLSEKDLHKAYETLVDPRLNYEQALEMAMLIAGS